MLAYYIALKLSPTICMNAPSGAFYPSSLPQCLSRSCSYKPHHPATDYMTEHLFPPVGSFGF